MNPESADLWLIIFVGVTALAFTLQAVAIARTAITVRHLSQKLEKQSQKMEGTLDEMKVGLTSLNESLEPLKSMADNLAQNAETLAESLRARAEDVDSLVGEVVDAGREQVSKIDYLVTDTMHKFEETTEVIQQDVLRPALEISALVKGVRAGLDVLFSRRPATPPENQPEEELFI